MLDGIVVFLKSSFQKGAVDGDISRFCKSWKLSTIYGFTCLRVEEITL